MAVVFASTDDLLAVAADIVSDSTSLVEAVIIEDVAPENDSAVRQNLVLGLVHRVNPGGAILRADFTALLVTSHSIKSVVLALDHTGDEVLVTAARATRTAGDVVAGLFLDHDF